MGQCLVGVAGSPQEESKVLKVIDYENNKSEKVILVCTQHVVIMIFRAGFILVSLFQAHLI